MTNSNSPSTYPSSWTLSTFSEVFAGVAAYAKHFEVPATPIGSVAVSFGAFSALSQTLAQGGSPRELFQTGATFLLMETSHLAVGAVIGELLATGLLFTPQGIAAVAIAAALVWGAEQISEAFGDILGGLVYDVGVWATDGLAAAWENLKSAIEGLLNWQIDGGAFADVGDILGGMLSPLLQALKDPLVLDLDGDGVELVSLSQSTAHFDYGDDGFAERSGWVAPDDGILAIDRNGNGTIDGAAELFGSANLDGFEVLEALDSNGDGKIDAEDAAFAQMRVWRDLDSDGAADDGELQTLTEAGIASIQLSRTDVPGTNQGHTVGFGATFTRLDGTTGDAQTIYFETDRRDTVPVEAPAYTLAEGVDDLFKLPSSGNIFPIAYVLSTDAALRTAWTALADQADDLTIDVVNARIQDLILQWAGVDDVSQSARGEFVDARHLAFVEAFFGDTYREVRGGVEVRTSPGSAASGAAIEGSFQQIVAAYTTMFLAQLASSQFARAADPAAALGDVLSSPYFAYSLLDFRTDLDEGETPSPTPGNLGAVVALITSLAPTNFADAVKYYDAALTGLRGMISVAFESDRTAYASFMRPLVAGIADTELRSIVSEAAAGTAAHGSAGNDGLALDAGDNVFVGGKGHDGISSGAGSDTFVYSKGDGHDWINDTSTSLTETDSLIFTDLNRSDIEFLRNPSNDLFIKIVETGDVIEINDFFREAGAHLGVDRVRFADGTLLNRTEMTAAAVYAPGSASSQIHDSNFDDVMRSGQGHDNISLGAGNDTVIYAKGDGYDTISAGSGHDVLFLADLNPSDVEIVRSGYDLAIVVKETGEIVRNTYFFSPGLTSDLIFGDAGDDRLVLSIANTGDVDQFDGGDGVDTVDVSEFGAAVRIDFVTSNGVIETSDAEFLDPQDVRNVATIKRIENATGSAFSDTIKGDGAANNLDGGSGDDILDGRSGDDLLRGGDGNDLLTGGLGDDQLKGGFGGDTYVFGSAYDNDVIEEGGIDDPAIDTLDLDVHANDLVIFRIGDDAIIERVGSSETIQIKGQFAPSQSQRIEAFAFSDQTLSHTDFALGAIDETSVTHRGTAVAETLSDTVGDDILSGHGGDDILLGSAGSDTYLYRSGNGNDVIKENSASTNETDILRLTNLNADDLTMTKTDRGLNILVDATGETIRIDWQFWAVGENWGIDRIEFADGTTWTRSQIEANLQIAGLIGTSGADTIDGTSQDDRIEGLSGNDTVNAGGGDDTLIGGLGNDTLYGQGGSDTYSYNAGDGDDRIFESYAPGETDKLVLGSSLTAANAVITRSSGLNDFTLSFAGRAGSIFVDYGFYGSGYGVEQIVFGDGTIWGQGEIRAAYLAGVQTSGNDSINGFSDNETITAGLGNDTISGQAGSDTYIYNAGDGDDRIYESYSPWDTDKLVLGAGLNVANVIVTRSSGLNDFTLSFSGQAGSVFIDYGFYGSGYGVEQIVFGDGTIWSLADVRAAYWSSVITSGNDVINGFSDNDTIAAGLGNDTISGQGGADSYIYNAGDGDDRIYESYSTWDTDRLVFGTGLNVADVIVTRSGQYDFALSFTGHAGSIFVDYGFYGSGYGIEEFLFADGTIWTGADIRAAYWSSIQTSGNDTISGFSGNDTITGGLGNDVLAGQGGADTYIYNAGDGDDRINEGYASGETDKLLLGAGLDVGDAVLTRSNSNVWDVSLSFAGQSGSITIQDGVWNASGYGVEQVVFNDGTVWTQGDLLQRAWFRGTTGNDTITGSSGDDQIDGGAGNDTLSAGGGVDRLVGGSGDDLLTGGSGSNTFVFAAGFGNDTMTDFSAGSSYGDILEFDDTVFDNLSAVFSAASQVGADTLITYDGSNSVLLKNVTLGALQSDDFRFV